MIQLILGGARSGKSALAEKLASQTDKKVLYLATANIQHNDAEMTTRIQHHRNSRPDSWDTIEVPVSLGEEIKRLANAQHCLLVDCLTLWLSNCLLDDDREHWHTQRATFFDALADAEGEIILVSNEVGSGIVPLGEINRRFVDETGFLHQQLASISDRVVLVTAGLPQVLKGKHL